MKKHWDIDIQSSTAKFNDGEEALEFEFEIIKHDEYTEIKPIREIKNTISDPMRLPRLMRILGDEYKILHVNN